MKDISSFPFDETIRHTGHTCLTVVSSGLSIASQSIPDPGIVRGGDACGRPPNDYDRRVVQTRRWRCLASSVVNWRGEGLGPRMRFSSPLPVSLHASSQEPAWRWLSKNERMRWRASRA